MQRPDVASSFHCRSGHSKRLDAASWKAVLFHSLTLQRNSTFTLLISVNGAMHFITIFKCLVLLMYAFAIKIPFFFYSSRSRFGLTDFLKSFWIFNQVSTININILIWIIYIFMRFHKFFLHAPCYNKFVYSVQKLMGDDRSLYKY